MIEVTVFYDRYDYLCGYDVKGHAEAGNDVVYAAVSVLTQTVLHGLKKIVDVKEQIGEGYMWVTLARNSMGHTGAQLALNLLLLGLHEIDNTYPGHLKIKMVVSK